MSHHRFILVAATLSHGFPGAWEQYCNDRVHFTGLNKWSNSSSHPLHDHPLYLPGDHMWQSQHSHSYQSLFSAPSSYVFFSEPPGLCRHRLFIFCYTQYACKFPGGEKYHLLSWMCHSTWFSCFLWVNWMLPSGCHGIWSLRGNLQPTALFHQNVHTSLCSVTHSGLCRWFSQCLVFYYLLLLFTFLRTKSSQSFFLWFCSFGWTLLFWYQYPRSCPLIYSWLHHCGHGDCHGHLLILITILKMRSTEGHHKAFGTCTSHLTAVALFYGTITFIYVMPKSSYSTDQNKVVSVFYTVVIPMLNPLIYSLRNSEINEALKRELC